MPQHETMTPEAALLALTTGGASFVLADGLDRYLATYDPSAPKPPEHKFTSPPGGAGTMANTLNVASAPGPLRLGVAVAAAAVPAAASVVVEDDLGRAALQGAALGAGVKLFSTVWNSFVMPMLIGKDTSTPALQRSVVARLYPAEVSAHVAIESQKNAPGPFSSAGALSGTPQPQFPDLQQLLLEQSLRGTVAGDSPYADTAESLRRAAGLAGDSPYDDVHAALRHQAGLRGDSPYPDAGQALRRASGVGWEPAGPPTVGPGPAAEPHKDSQSCGCVGEDLRYASFLGNAEERDTSHFTFRDVQTAVANGLRGRY